jgi:hypothetical protein
MLSVINGVSLFHFFAHALPRSSVLTALGSTSISICLPMSASRLEFRDLPSGESVVGLPDAAAFIRVELEIE